MSNLAEILIFRKIYPWKLITGNLVYMKWGESHHDGCHCPHPQPFLPCGPFHRPGGPWFENSSSLCFPQIRCTQFTETKCLL